MQLDYCLAGIFTLFFLLSSSAQDNFQILYSGPGDDEIVWVIPSNDGNIILAGNTTSSDTDGDGLIMKSDMQGNIIWSRTYGGANGDVIVKIISCNDGGYVAIGYTNSFGHGERDAWITRIDENGMVLWSDCYGTFSFDGARGITQLPDGSFIVVGQIGEFIAGFILALDSQGQFLWEKQYTDNTVVFWFNTILETGNGGYYITGAINHSGFGIHDTFILETDPNGNILWTKYFGGNSSDSFRELVPFEDGFLAIGDTWSYQAPQSGWIVKLRSDFSVDRALVLGEPGIDYYDFSFWLNSTSIYCALYNSDHNAFIAEFDHDLNPVNSWQFSYGSSTSSNTLTGLPDGKILFAGHATDLISDDDEAYLVKFDPGDATYDCNLVLFSPIMQNTIPSSADLFPDPTNISPLFQQVNIQSGDISLVPDRLCSVLPVADFISPGLECEGEFASVENASLYGETYEWYFEGGIPPYCDEQFPDSILYLLPGTYEIKLVVRNIFGADSLTRTITINQLPEVFLGADTSMSPGQILVLDAGTLMDTYLWQDGSNGQTYNVTESGEYRVIVSKDGCYATDTILVSFDDCIASLFVPNCFTPNQDGYNDTFMPVSQNLDEFNMLIFNRWGELLYETDNPENGWNGKVNGKICPIGTYFYLVKYTTECSSGMEKDGTLKGSVTLLE